MRFLEPKQSNWNWNEKVTGGALDLVSGALLFFSAKGTTALRKMKTSLAKKKWMSAGIYQNIANTIKKRNYDRMDVGKWN